MRNAENVEYVAALMALCEAIPAIFRSPRLDALPLFVQTLRSRSSSGIYDRRPPPRPCLGDQAALPPPR